ncbi:DUF4202 domain-containing protein [Siculibacillus lacustris]|uniref:DUF4202 domain-containing protein n=1 Tax=Siculibacillus lacustris TaxID=1549641 RepID=A0A4V2KUE8_9HYPH|nr:DUF4202 domain-containing protein [Siculibacillus lacustris]TBW41245.1 DUF4202 domain-containing protein [Siculibacillus lacustris]
MSEIDARLAAVFARIDAANAEDPTRIPTEAGERPHALVYGERMSAWLARLVPEASDLLQIAVRAQHLRRFDIPRSAHPMDKPGYFAWRNALKAHHATLVGGFMGQAGYDAEAIARVGSIVRKERLKRDVEAQALEDCACLVFLEFEFAPFADKHADDKVVDIVAKTWTKMSAAGHARALELVPSLPERLRTLTVRAVAG